MGKVSAESWKLFYPADISELQGIHTVSCELFVSEAS